ncbi:MAG: MFS transporter [Deltaproteobacteria bacterium]|nr:MFS transporter [Deltaproteobacteria bacterium]
MNSDHKKIVRSWIMYYWANSAFATSIMAAVLPEFYTSFAGATLHKTTATSYWGYSNTIAMLIIAITAPLLGAMADHSGAKKRYLGSFAAVGIAATALLLGTGKGMWLYASLLYVFGRVGFGGAKIFYDSLLPHVARNGEIDKVSAQGYACGYLGGGILLAFNLLMIMKPGMFGIPDAAWASRISFLTVAVWWAAFSIPILRNVSEPRAVVSRDESTRPFVAGYQRLQRTSRDIRRFRELITFLVAFWLLAFLVSMVQGGTQALSRSMYGSMSPPSKSAEFFGFYNVSSKFAGIIGPALFGVVGQVTGTSRLSIIAIVIFFVAGGLILAFVDQAKGIEAAKSEEREERTRAV